MKKLLSVLLALTLLLAAAGCGNAPASASESEPASEPALDLSKLDETALRETLRPYLDAYNLYLADTFGAEWGEASYLRYYESEDAAMSSALADVKAMALSSDPAPEGLVADPSYADCFPVTNYASIADIDAAFADRIDTAAAFYRDGIAQNFMEYDGALYLVRGGRGYGATRIDPESAVLLSTVTTSSSSGDTTDWKVQADSYLFDEKDVPVTLVFALRDGKLLLTAANWE